jgi:hypothetical protein
MEATTILARLERTTLEPYTARRVFKGIGAYATTGKGGRGVRFTADDLAAARLVLKLESSGVSALTARRIVGTLRDTIIHAWRLQLPMLFCVTSQGHSHLLLGDAAHLGDVLALVQLQAVPADIEAAMREVQQ